MLDFSVTFVITIINITILFFILKAVLFKPVTKFMADRTKRIQDSLEKSAKDNELAKKLLEEYEKRLETAEAEAEKIIRSARKQAEEDAERILSQSKVEAERVAETARVKLETDRRAALALFRTEAVALVLNASGRILKRELVGAEQQRYAAEMLDQIALEHESRVENGV